MTQSCDLAVRPDGRSAVDEVILSPFYALPQLSGHKVYGKPQGWEEARKGRHAGYHVLNRCDIPGHELDYLLVDLSPALSQNCPKKGDRKWTIEG